DREPGQMIIVMADLLRDSGVTTIVSPAFATELARRLGTHGASTSVHAGPALPMSWLEQRLAEAGLTLQDAPHQESQAQAADQVSIGNSINSLRFIASMDWREFVETLSVVEAALRDDPADVYSDMDFATRDYYRHAVEEIARHCPLSEEQVARAAVEL